MRCSLFASVDLSHSRFHTIPQVRERPYILPHHASLRLSGSEALLAPSDDFTGFGHLAALSSFIKVEEAAFQNDFLSFSALQAALLALQAALSALQAALSALLAALAGFLYAGLSNVASVTLVDSAVLPSVAAAVIGGTSIMGGRGGYGGTIVGALILTVLTSLLSILGLPEAVRQVLFGSIIVAVAAAYTRVTGEH